MNAVDLAELLAHSMGANVEAARMSMDWVYCNPDDFPTKEEKITSYQNIKERYTGYIDLIADVLKKTTEIEYHEKIDEYCFYSKARVDEICDKHVFFTKYC